MITLYTLFYKWKIKFHKLTLMLGVPRGQMALDIGGGDGPFPRADVVCEKFITSDEERDHVFLYDRPLVIGDIEALPFKDKAFDYIYCSHVLEHANDPEQAVHELCRVGKKGYVEVPSEYLEYTAKSTPSHLWTVRREKENGPLVFTPKAPAQINPLIDRVYTDILYQKDRAYMMFHFKNFYTLFNVRCRWEKSIPIKINRNRNIRPLLVGLTKGRLEDLGALKKALRPAGGSASFKPKKWIKNLVRSLYCRKNIAAWYEANLACPFCKTPFLQMPVDQLVCRKCGKVFPVVNNVPVLLREHARPVSRSH